MASSAKDVSAELDWTAQLLSKAQTRAAALDDGVTTVQAQVAGNFPGIARNLDQLHPLIHEVQARIDTLSGQVAALAKEAQVDDDATPEDVVAALTPVKNGIDGVVTGILGVLDNLDRIDTMIAQCLKGGAPEDLLYLTNQVRLDIRDALKAAHGANKATDAKLSEAMKAGKA